MPFISTPLQNCTSLDFSQLPHLQDLQLAHLFTSDREFTISLLVGADYYWDIVGDKVVHGSGPTTVESKLGYLLSGPSQQKHPHSMAINVSVIVTPTQSHFDLEHFWTLESIGVSQGDDTAAIDMTENYLTFCVSRAVDGAYIARFPWRMYHSPLPTNYAVAERRTHQLVRKLVIKPKLPQLYNQCRD